MSTLVSCDISPRGAIVITKEELEKELEKVRAYIRELEANLHAHKGIEQFIEALLRGME